MLAAPARSKTEVSREFLIDLERKRFYTRLAFLDVGRNHAPSGPPQRSVVRLSGEASTDRNAMSERRMSLEAASGFEPENRDFAGQDEGPDQDAQAGTTPDDAKD